MNQMQYAMLTEVLGRWKSDVIESYLKTEELDVVLVSEAVSQIPTAVFAPVKIYVPKESFKRALNLLKAFEEAEDNIKES
jgi:hypothetical protein